MESLRERSESEKGNRSGLTDTEGVVKGLNVKYLDLCPEKYVSHEARDFSKNSTESLESSGGSRRLL